MLRIFLLYTFGVVCINNLLSVYIIHGLNVHMHIYMSHSEPAISNPGNNTVIKNVYIFFKLLQPF